MVGRLAIPSESERCRTELSSAILVSIGYVKDARIEQQTRAQNKDHEFGRYKVSIVSSTECQIMVARHTHQADNIEYMPTNEGADAC
jgi:hypothetical protein